MAPFGIVNIAVVIAGGAIVIAFVAVTSVRRAWPHTLALPAGPPHQLTAFDMVFAGWVFLVVRFMGAQVALVLVGSLAASQPATQPAGVESLAGEIGTLVGSIATIVVFVAIAAARFEGGLKAWRLAESGRPRWLGAALAVTIVSVSVCLLAYMASDHILRTVFDVVPQEHEKILLLERGDTPPSIVFMTVFGAVVVAPILEEMFFRGLLLPALVKWLGRPGWAVIVSGVLFGLIHAPVQASVAPLTIFGLILAVAYLRSGTLALPILIHGLFNARTVVWILSGAEPA